MMRRLPVSRRLRGLSATLLLTCFVGDVQAQKPEISLEDYCRLTVSLLNVSAGEWQDRIDVARKSQDRGDRTKLRIELEKATESTRTSEKKLLVPLGMSRRDYLDYAGKYRAEIAAYLEEYPDVKNEIESVRRRINDLIQEFESAVTPKREGVQR